jgi:hypothetical protein
MDRGNTGHTSSFERTPNYLSDEQKIKKINRGQNDEEIQWKGSNILCNNRSYPHAYDVGCTALQAGGYCKAGNRRC